MDSGRDSFIERYPEGFLNCRKPSNCLAILLVTFLGWLSNPLNGLSDLQLRDDKVTLNHMDCVLKFLLGCVGKPLSFDEIEIPWSCTTENPPFTSFGK